MSGAEIVSLLLSVTSKVLDKLPNYSEYKRNQFFRLLREYEEEVVLPFKYRDDQKVDRLRDELITFIRVFNRDLSKKTSNE